MVELKIVRSSPPASLLPTKHVVASWTNHGVQQEVLQLGGTFDGSNKFGISWSFSDRKRSLLASDANGTETVRSARSWKYTRRSYNSATNWQNSHRVDPQVLKGAHIESVARVLPIRRAAATAGNLEYPENPLLTQQILLIDTSHHAKLPVDSQTMAHSHNFTRDG
jgi:hypothetical protein